MQSLEVISINLWQILISLINLLLLFLIVKKFLYGPVKKVLADRQSALEKQYSDANEAETQALASKKMWEEKMHTAETEAAAIIQNATISAGNHSDKIINDARRRAVALMEKADAEIQKEKKKAVNEIKNEISGLAVNIAGKVIERDIKPEDHEKLISEFIDQMD